MEMGTVIPAVPMLPPTEVEPSAFAERIASREALGRLLEEFRPYLLMIARDELPASLERKLAPSDLVQETLVKGYEQAGTFRGQTPEEFARWLRQILLNHLSNTQKAFGRQMRDLAREQRAGSALVHPRAQTPSHFVLQRELQHRLELALGKLSTIHREVLLLRHRDDLSFVEIGNRLQRSDEAARKLWVRAVRQLQRELGIDDSAESPFV
jgi:RNA polymerase sigma-70 factor (ECF subfamily)